MPVRTGTQSIERVVGMLRVVASRGRRGMRIADLAEKQVVELDNDRKAAMVSNLLVVLCGEAEVTPVVNTGTLYQ